MSKGVVILVLTLILLLTISLYQYDELAREKMKYEFLKKEYLELSEKIELLNKKSIYLDQQLKNYTLVIENLKNENRKLRDDINMLKVLISSNPERREYELSGRDLESRLNIIRDAVRDVSASSVILTYSEIINISDAVYVDGEKFSFYYVDDENLFGGRDVLVNPEWFLIHRTGDCDDVAAAMAAVLKAKGYNVKVCGGVREGYNDSKHAWVRTEIGDIDYRYCINRVCSIEVSDFGNIAEKCVEV